VSFAEQAIRPVTRAEFGLFRELVESEIGIHLHDAKQALLNARLLSRIRELGLRTFSEYYERVVSDQADELTRLINAICTNETRFFREPAQFELLQSTIVPSWLQQADQGQRPRRLRVWSAGCSTGEEPYSLAMQLLATLPSSWSIEVTATDISTKVLEKSVAAVYPMRRYIEIPEDLRRRFVLVGVRERRGQFRIAPEVRACVRFARVNLMAHGAGTLGSFDLVLCRNVMIYFRAETRRKVVAWLCSNVAEGGYLWAGHSESLHDLDPRLRTVVPTVYRVVQEGEP